MKYRVKWGILLFVSIISNVSAQQVVTKWQEVFSNYVEVENYPKKVKFSNFSTETMKIQGLFVKEYKKDTVYKKGYVNLGFVGEKAVIEIRDVKNLKPIKGSVKKYFIGIKGYECVIRENIEDEWTPLKIRFIKELPNPYKKSKYDELPWDKIWKLQIQCKFFEGEYILQVDSGDFPVKD